MSKCKNCNCICHCGLQGHSDRHGVCTCQACSCGDDTIHELAKANPNKIYKELEQTKLEQATYETNGLVIDSTDDCESCQ